MATTTEVVRVIVPERSMAHDIRAVKIVLHREIIRFLNDRMRALSMLLQPILWLIVMGAGIGSMVRGMPGGTDGFKSFVFPGVIAMSVIMTAMFSAASIVWDREFGFLREMLVAPVSRTAIVIGKCLGGALVATLQGIVILALAGAAGVPYEPMLMLTLVAEMFLASFTIASLGVLLAVQIKNMQSFFGIMQMAIMPLMMLSGALFPISNLPGWLGILTQVNPITYAVDPMRQAVFAYLDVPPEAAAMLNPGVSVFGWTVPVGVELLFVAVCGVALLAAAVLRFRRTE